MSIVDAVAGEPLQVVESLTDAFPTEAVQGPKQHQIELPLGGAGWSIKHPGNWQISSCRQCPDPTDPNVYVSFYNPATKELIMIESLRDKPADQTADQWLNDVSVATNLNPRVSEEWISLGGTRALKVINGIAASQESENIY